MPRKKHPPGPSFNGPLDKPIDNIGPWGCALSDLMYPENIEKRWRERTAKLTAARIEKLPLLCKHYSIDDDADASTRFFILAMRLAIDFVPGFWDADSPHTPRGKGRLKWPPDEWLLMMVGGLKGRHWDGKAVTTDVEACAIVAELLDPDLKRPSQKADRQKRALTLANRLGPARRTHDK